MVEELAKNPALLTGGVVLLAWVLSFYFDKLMTVSSHLREVARLELMAANDRQRYDDDRSDWEEERRQIRFERDGWMQNCFRLTGALEPFVGLQAGSPVGTQTGKQVR